MKHTLNTRGLSVVELLLWTSIVGAVLMVLARLGVLPTRMAKSLGTAMAQETSVKALDLVVDDLKQADSSSFPMASMVKANGGALDWFKIYNLRRNPPLSYVYYQFQLGTNSTTLGAVSRCVNDVAPRLLEAQCTTILDRVIQPDSTTPLFQQDAANPTLLIVNLFYQPGSFQDRVKTVRRVSLRS